jgi:Conserved in the green lineage and diatoms 27
LRLYLGWVYVCDRLSNATIFYEESGWYDGQEWTKPEEVLQRDNLIVNYQLRSWLKRLKLTFATIAGLFVLGGGVWIFL